ncbi:hypothetical protein [Gloeocapsopsis sp. IPPAS B-1203]|uniref:hypothetical protein n=1 Tax=Gloeocapsopsis sp. IPPAS B-1203 TaxID=2049454 RepID=UPI000C197E47|nr:hypothetical protein [Gloeocapsopsis sp. IPPAS B-1203]PIG93719.1 hypothetical protein CSQ79_08805 [Gloeocapsopsis sp. IPPAS B-1203]
MGSSKLKHIKNLAEVSNPPQPKKPRIVGRDKPDDTPREEVQKQPRIERYSPEMEQFREKIYKGLQDNATETKHDKTND